MRVSIIAIIAFCVVSAMCGSVAASAHSDGSAAAAGVLRRLVGDRASEFVFVIDTTLRKPAATSLKKTFADSFTVSAANGTVTVRGPTGATLAAGAYWYLKNVTKCIVTWGEDGTGNQLSLPATLPDVLDTTVENIVPLRYAWNMCTFDYSAVWWDAARWTREIDWMALHGINMPLALTGQEYAWMILLQQHGVSLEELDQWFTGPAFLAWQRAGNVRKWAGPLSRHFIENQRTLQKGILHQMRQLGMTPVLPCFSGHVPKAIHRVFPNATLTQSPAWNNFPPDMTDVYMLDPTQPTFSLLGQEFMKVIVQEYGTSSYYSCDTFNEVNPTSTNPTYLADSARSVVDSIRSVDPEGVWVMQAWLFHNSYWTPQRVEAYLGGVPNDTMLILDLNAEDGALANLFNQYYGKPWIWNMLHNYGGVRGMYGNLTRIATGPLEDLHRENSTMVGIGFTPEAIEQNPIMYELLTSTFYAKTPINVQGWLNDYITQRYGVAATNPHVQSAWYHLLAAVYSQAGAPRTEIEHIPTWQEPDFGWQYGNPVGMVAAANSFLTAANAIANATTNGPFQYDFVDAWRQASTMFFTDVHRVLVNQLTASWYSGRPLNASKVQPAMSLMLDLIQTIDDLLGTNPNYQFGLWTTRAAALASDANETDNFVYNAKNQVTLWGPDGQITDYAAKAWHGLYGSYYKERWSLMFSSVISQGTAQWNMYEFRQEELLPWEQAWCSNASRKFSPRPTGKNPTKIATQLQQMITGNLTSYTAHPNKMGGQSLGQYAPMWTNSPAQLAVLCDLQVDCAGFDTSGYLWTGITTLVPSFQATTLFVKNSQ